MVIFRFAISYSTRASPNESEEIESQRIRPCSIMSKPSAAQERAKNTEKSSPCGAPNESTHEARTPDAPNLGVLLASMLAKTDEKFEAFRR